MQLIIDLIALVTSPVVLVVLMFAAFMAGCCAAWLVLVLLMGDEPTEHLECALREADLLLMNSENQLHRLRGEVQQLREALRIHEAA